MKPARAVLLTLAMLSFSGCIPEGGQRLQIPYRAQEQYNYCASASILMWRLYHGLTPISQMSIHNWMGGTGCTTAPNVTAAVNHFTLTRDAYWDYASHAEHRALISRQITAFAAETPSIVVVNSNHTVVVNGGSWHSEGATRMWDNVYAHDPDPAYGANRYFSAGSWIRAFCPEGASFCDQIVSRGATSDWSYYMQTYGGDVQAYGWNHDLGGPRQY